jgi:hypothetical protein
MCETCWAEKFGYVRFDSEEVRGAAKAIEEVYRWHSCGGHLHVQLADWNLWDEFWREDCRPPLEYLGEVGDEELGAYQKCFDLMEKLDEFERASALALYEGFWS